MAEVVRYVVGIQKKEQNRVERTQTEATQPEPDKKKKKVRRNENQDE